LRATLCALILAFAVWPLAARADDSGPRRDVAAIRHDLTIVHRGKSSFLGVLRARMVVDTILVSDGHGLMQLHYEGYTNGVYSEIEMLVLRYGRWWDEGTAYAGTSNQAAVCPILYAPSTSFLSSAGVSEALVTLASQYMSVVREADALVERWRLAKYRCGTDYYDDHTAPYKGASFDSEYEQLVPHAGGYEVSLQWAENDAPANSLITGLTGRAPTEGESWANPPTGNSYFFFSGTVQSTQPVHVHAGTVINVWFPFLLDPSLRYGLTIAGHGFTAIGPVDGTLPGNNTLHFVLPAFTAPPGVELMGEIESD
jgi:hypothetical protein